MLSPFFYSLFTYDCESLHDSNTIVKFADDTTVGGRVRNNDETAYRGEVQHQAEWCTNNNLVLNTKKTKEIVVDFRRRRRNRIHNPICINEEEVEKVTSFKFLGVHISERLTWTTNTSTLVKKANKRLFFLRKLAKLHLSPPVLLSFYRCAIESILCTGISIWHSSCTAKERNSVQRVVNISQRIIKDSLPSIKSVYRKRCLRRAQNIIRDSSHPNHGLFTRLRSTRSGVRFRSLRSRTNRTNNSFFHSAIRLLNETPILAHSA